MHTDLIQEIFNITSAVSRTPKGFESLLGYRCHCCIKAKFDKTVRTIVEKFLDTQRVQTENCFQVVLLDSLRKLCTINLCAKQSFIAEGGVEVTLLFLPHSSHCTSIL